MFEALIASVFITLLSLTGALLFGEKARFSIIHPFILPVAVGVFLGVIFFELLPETLEASHEWGPVAILAGFLGFYLLSHLLDTYHHHHASHEDDCVNHGARRLLIGDGIHNFADGVVIASAFMINPAVGVLTTIGIALHEIPQEVAEFGVLLHAGYTRSKAMLYNSCSASTVVFGVLAALFFSEFLEPHLFILTGIAAGNLLYIATADLIPALRENNRNHFAYSFLTTLIGVVVIGLLIHLTHSFLV